MNVIQVREYATIGCDTGGVVSSLDHGMVKQATFDWLLELQQQWHDTVPLLHIEGKTRLKLGNYIGYLQSPCGEGIEILPKIIDEAHDENINRLRHLLQKMLQAVIGLKPRTATHAEIMRQKQPIHEWIFSRFLSELTDLVKQGLKFDYLNQEEQCTYIRGQLNMTRQLRQTPDQAMRFHIRYAAFLPNRIENRLLRTALDLVLRQTSDSQNWRVANNLRTQLIELCPLANPMALMPQWTDNKYLKGYRSIKPWCELILKQFNPNFQKGKHQGIALLFPMEQLFEGYIHHHLKSALTKDYRVVYQAYDHALVTHTPANKSQAEAWFRLKPDFVIQGKANTQILDAKWKVLDTQNLADGRKYGLSQSDLYQMFAYGHKYLQGNGHMMLIYPKNKYFTAPLAPFLYSAQLQLWCVPFDLIENKLVPGEWSTAFPCYKSTQNERALKI